MENKELADKQCFECGKSPSDWASINNGIFLCLKCSAGHRDFGPNVSFIKSLTLDVWNDNMFKFMQKGGNFRLRHFLNQASVPSTLDKGQLYSSKLMGYYRRLLKSQVANSLFNEPMPSEEEYWLPDRPGQEIDNIYMNKLDNFNPMPFKSQISQPIPQFPQFPQFNQGSQLIKDPNFPKAPPQEFPQNPNIPSSNPYSQYPSFGNPYSKYPPDDNQPQQEYLSNTQFNPYSKNQPENQYNPNSNSNQYQYQYNQNSQNPPSTQNQQAKGFEVINNGYSNPNPNSNQYPNKGNDIYSQYNRLYGETGTTQKRSIGSGVSDFFSKVWDKTKETTSNIKDKYNDSKFGQKLNSAGHKTVEGMKVAGNKIAETGTNIANSQAMQTVKEKTTNSYSYVKDKIAGSSNQQQNNNYNYY